MERNHHHTFSFILIILLIITGSYYVYTLQKNSGNDQPLSSLVPQNSSIARVQIPLLIDSGNANYGGTVIGCDKVVMTDRDVSVTTGPLTAVYTALFSDKTPWPPIDSPGNFISTRDDLKFDHVDIVQGVANVYLTGSVGPLGGVCDDPRLKAQIEQAALQFPTVLSVQSYLNGVKTDLVFSEK